MENQGVVKLTALKLDDFKLFQNKIIEWNAASPSNFGVIVVRDFTERSTLFEAFEYVFGRKTDEPFNASVTATFSICDDNDSDGIRVFKTKKFKRRQTVVNGTTKSVFEISPNPQNADEFGVVKSKEYRKQLFELKLNGVALQFLIGRQLTGYLAKPGHDIREFLEVCFHPEEKAKQRKKTEMAIGKLSRKVDAVGGCMQVLREFEVSYAYAKEESVKVEKMRVDKSDARHMEMMACYKELDELDQSQAALAGKETYPKETFENIKRDMQKDEVEASLISKMTSDLRSGMEQNSNDFLHIILYVRKHFGEDDIYRIDHLGQEIDQLMQWRVEMNGLDANTFARFARAFGRFQSANRQINLDVDELESEIEITKIKRRKLEAENAKPNASLVKFTQQRIQMFEALKVGLEQELERKKSIGARLLAMQTKIKASSERFKNVGDEAIQVKEDADPQAPSRISLKTGSLDYNRFMTHLRINTDQLKGPNQTITDLIQEQLQRDNFPGNCRIRSDRTLLYDEAKPPFCVETKGNFVNVPGGGDALTSLQLHEIVATKLLYLNDIESEIKVIVENIKMLNARLIDFETKGRHAKKIIKLNDEIGDLELKLRDKKTTLVELKLEFFRAEGFEDNDLPELEKFERYQFYVHLFLKSGMNAALAQLDKDLANLRKEHTNAIALRERHSKLHGAQSGSSTDQYAERKQRMDEFEQQLNQKIDRFAKIYRAHFAKDNDRHEKVLNGFEMRFIPIRRKELQLKIDRLNIAIHADDLRANVVAQPSAAYHHEQISVKNKTVIAIEDSAEDMRQKLKQFIENNLSDEPDPPTDSLVMAGDEPFDELAEVRRTLKRSLVKKAKDFDRRNKQFQKNFEVLERLLDDLEIYNGISEYCYDQSIEVIATPGAPLDATIHWDWISSYVPAGKEHEEKAFTLNHHLGAIVLLYAINFLVNTPLMIVDSFDYYLDGRDVAPMTDQLKTIAERRQVIYMIVTPKEGVPSSPAHMVWKDTQRSEDIGDVSHLMEIDENDATEGNEDVDMDEDDEDIEYSIFKANRQSQRVHKFQITDNIK